MADKIFVSSVFDLSTVLGRKEDDALALLKAANREARVVNRDGKPTVGTDDRISRVNLYVVDGIVNSYTIT